MSDDTHPYQQSDFEPEEEQAQDEHGGQPKPPPSRLDRLMSAKDKAEKEAARWSEIEKLGKPLPSHDQLGQDVTQPYTIEPLKKEGDTPQGQDTPSQPSPPADSAPPQAARHQRPAPPFPHPTDQPTPPAPAPRAPGNLSHPTDTPPQAQFSEPPMPEQTDQADVRRGIRPSGGQPHQRYQPPPDSIDEVRVDSDGMPLPRRVPLEDADATLVGESAYRDETLGPLTEPTRPSMPRTEQQPSQPTTPVYSRVTGYQPARPSRSPRRKPSPLGRRFQFSWGCLARAIGLGFIGMLVIGMLGGGGIAIYYAQVTAPAFRGIHSIDDLQQKALQFQTTRILDAEGELLYKLNDPEGGFRDYVTLGEVSPWVIVATVATEERLYFTNPGFSIPAMTRAVYMAYKEDRAIAGTSTITQQLTRALLLEEGERTERSYQRKVKEIFLAGELARRFSKREVLELYLNQIYYGNLAYGIEAAAQTYFDKSARDLTMAEASFLVGLPQAPAVWDPVTDKEAALVRQKQVLTLMLRAGCIDPGQSGLDLSAYCVDDARMAASVPELDAVAAREYHAPAFQARYPHWVVYVQQMLENDPDIGPQALYASGYDVYTTLDPRLQDLAQAQVDLVLSGLTDRNVTNASVVIINPHTGAILAMVGSKDFDDESIDGQVNVALTPQQPGSSIKPFTYLTAFRKGWTPSTVIWDVPIIYEIPGFGSYEPVNYDGRFHGPVPARTALANSYNIPAVLTLDYVGVPALLQTLNDVGISSLGDSSNPKNFGLSLTLGAGEVYLLEWTNAFATIASGGQYHPPYAIQRIELNGEPIREYEVPEGKQVVEPDLVYLLTSILSDTEARIPAFGAESPLSPPYPAAAKTGTTNDFRDNWTMGFLTDLAVGVWVGNTDNSPMIEVSGVTGAGPIWRGIMDGAQQWYPAKPFPRPSDIIEQTVCSDDGALPSPYCIEHSEVRTDVFAANNPPPPEDQGLYRELRVDQFTGLIANEHCTDFVEDKFFVVLPNPSQYMGIDMPAFERDWLINTDGGRDWATRRGIALDSFEVAPTEACKPDTPRPTIVIDTPQPGSEQKGVVRVSGTVDAPNFSHYTVEFGVSEDPIGWGVMQGATAQVVHSGPLAQADLSAYSSGLMTIRVTVFDTQGHRAERRVVFMYVQPTATPQPTPTTTPTQAPTATPTITPATLEATATVTVTTSEAPTTEETP
ncbi:MAG: transglycosylase domain-containing protein [Anaerolineae bacterium]|nr:transglycosylase domain-containing protein [Anaerolineae bacterium]